MIRQAVRKQVQAVFGIAGVTAATHRGARGMSAGGTPAIRWQRRIQDLPVQSALAVLR